MQEIRDDIWSYGKIGHIVVTTNGHVNSRGQCVMGRGIALQAAKRFPHLPGILAARIQATGNHLYHFPLTQSILTFPVKEVWWEPAKQYLIQRSCQELLNWLGDRQEQVFIPHAGCANGGLDWLTQVKPIFEQEFGDDDRIVVVDRA